MMWLKEINMDNNTRDFYLYEGKEVPRVSTILGMLNNPGLIYWAHQLGWKKERLNDGKEKDARIGTIVHDVLYKKHDVGLVKINYEDYNIPYDYYDYTVEGVINCLKSYNTFAYKNPDFVKPLYREHTISCSLFGGTIDLITPLGDDGVVIADYKTSKTFYSTMFLQLGAYIYLFENQHKDKEVKGARIILLDKKEGKCAKDWFFSREDMQIFIDTFLQLTELYYSMESINEKIKF